MILVKKQILIILSGFGLTFHHMLETSKHVWFSTNQAFYRCHGKLGIILMSIGLILFLQNIYNDLSY